MRIVNAQSTRIQNGKNGAEKKSNFLSVFQTLVNWLKMFHLQLQKSETRMTPSILKQDPNTENTQKNTIY